MADLGQFQQRIRVVAAGMNQNVNRLVRETALVALRNVVLATPVDTGRARSNWLVDIGAPPSGTISPHSPGGGLGAGETANATAAINAGASRIASRRENGGDVYITNNVHYIEKLNGGSSAQAPAGFVQRAVLSAVSYIRNKRVLP